MQKKVLVPLDGSELAECALFHVESFAEDGCLGEVTILNVLAIDIPWKSAYEKDFNLNVLREKAFTQSRKYLDGVAARLGAHGIKVKTEAMEANHPAAFICDYARDNGMDMIFVTTHGHSGIKEMLLGSVALGLLNQSHVPVYLIRPEACRL
ncbi:MAG: universal stress protein [Syntrophales bacterium]|nr:universal stress protein [Syntrophales bacterium]